MWCSDRRRLLILGAAGLLAGCGFAPVHGPGGAARALAGQVAMPVPRTRADYLFVRRLEERLGPASAPRYRLEAPLEITRDSLGTTADGLTTRYQYLGQSAWRLLPAEAGTGAPALAQGRVEGFTGYSSTGSTLATRAAERDAEARLATILADRIVDRLLLAAPGLRAA
ncbi:MAG: LPS assembly lipoprotein LptE [Rhodosalinus sp.]